jgi:hypothetical protein
VRGEVASQYRFYVTDAVDFYQSLGIEVEHGIIGNNLSVSVCGELAEGAFRVGGESCHCEGVSPKQSHRGSSERLLRACGARNDRSKLASKLKYTRLPNPPVVSLSNQTCFLIQTVIQ